MGIGHPIIAVVKQETRLEGLKARWATERAAQFRMQQAVAHEKARRKAAYAAAAPAGAGKATDMDFTEVEALAGGATYEAEDEAYQHSLQGMMRDLEQLGFPVKTIDRGFVPNFDFGRCLLVVVVGRDGLVANVAKYVGDLPIIGVNPDPARNDGVLLPFEVRHAREIVRRTIERRQKVREVTLAEVNTNEGLRMLAFNDFFIGCDSHVSARYTIEMKAHVERQSSSGVLVSTGAGSTGWLSSIFNMTDGISRFVGHDSISPMKLNWEDRRLIWAVREPFRSKNSDVGLVAGLLDGADELVIGSQMPTNGVIFSDGVEADFIEFNSGTIARFSVSKQRAHLVVG